MGCDELDALVYKGIKMQGVIIYATHILDALDLF
jgi:hypothetical protein